VQPELHVLGITLQTFGLCLGAAFIVCGILSAQYLKEIGKPVDWAYEFVFAALIGGIVGARLWWVAEHFSQAKGDPVGSLFGGSGLVFHGGALGGAIAVLGWSWHKGWMDGRAFDQGAAPLAAGYAIGRIGCQLSGDGDYGIPWNGPWAMAYPHGTVPTTVTVHPTPVYETLVMGLVCVLLWRWRHRFRPGNLFALWAVLAGAERFLVEFIRRNDAVVAGLTQPQLISIAMLLAGGAWIATHGGLARVSSEPAPVAPRARPARQRA
jgi:phosphatidylglycerol:prolipoprotein diacylglycerol transferase